LVFVEAFISPHFFAWTHQKIDQRGSSDVKNVTGPVKSWRDTMARETIFGPTGRG
jgi:hypothetical protein